MSQLLEQLLDAPNARLLIEQVQAELQREATQRQAFYDWIREDQKAEFINGEIILHSPVRRKHWKAVGLLDNLLHNYAIMNELGEVATEKAMISLTRNDYDRADFYDSCNQGRIKIFILFLSMNTRKYTMNHGAARAVCFIQQTDFAISKSDKDLMILIVALMATSELAD